ncbi:recombinase family protein [Pantoea agglomerans]|uniref:recombinase family protein n=1 Tax=Enterobacter agglomerans TaxID=549 RepID=UPI00301BB466
MKYGYARVSTQEQNTGIQVAALTELGCERVYQENISGKNAQRPELVRLLADVKEGDTVVVMKLDRLARNTRDALSIADELKAKGVGLVCMDLGQTDINSDIGRVIYTVIAAVGEFERKRILERTNEGKKAAKERGVVFGPKPDEALHTRIRELYEGGMNKLAISKELSISRTTVHKVLN